MQNEYIIIIAPITYTTNQIMAPENEKEEGTDNENLFDKYWNEEVKSYDEKPDSEAVYNKLKDEIFPPVNTSIVSIKKSRRWIGYATVMILLAGSAVWFAKTRSNQESVTDKIVSISTEKGETKIISLPDSSKVQLLENSTISYSSLLGSASTRQVTLNGDASFTVVHNSKKPFVLLAGILTIKDIGTVFNVTMNNKATNGLSIKVTEGSVSVQKGRATKNETILTKGDEAVYNKGNYKLEVKKSGMGNAASKKSIEFDNAPIANVLKKLADTYDVKLTIEGGKTTTKTYTGTFENKNIDEILDMIGFTLNFKHSRKDDAILISFYGNEK